MELANGYFELDRLAQEQARSFPGPIRALRRAMALAVLPVDDRTGAALQAGLPACAGCSGA